MRWGGEMAGIEIGNPGASTSSVLGEFPPGALWQHLIGGSPVGIVITRGAEHVVEYVNASFCEITGQARERTLSCSLRDVLGEGDRTSVAILGRVYATGEAESSVERELHLPNGDVRYVRYSVLPLPDATGRTGGLILVGHDVTEQTFTRRINERLLITSLRELERAEVAEQRATELGALLETLSEGLVIADGTGRPLLVNQAGRQMTGAETDQFRTLEDCRSLDLRRLDGTPLPFEQWPINRAVRGERFDDCEGILVRPDGQAQRMVASAAGIADAQGKIALAILVFRNITEKERIVTELQKIQKLESLGFLAGGIAHDLNNILTAIVGNLSLAKMRDKADPLLSEFLDNAEEAVFRARDLAGQLLTFSKGGMPIKELTSIAQLVYDSASFVLSGSNVKAEFNLPADLRTLEIDKGQIGQVVQNVVLNAKEAMPDGGRVRISASNVMIASDARISLEPGPYLKIAITDHGCGIAKEHLPTIFDPYFTTKSKGAGLGLAIAYSIIKKHKGTIEVDSKVGAGSTFTIYLPASQEPMRACSRVASWRFEGKRKLLVMDDEQMIREVAEALLANLGFEVTTVADGAAALEACRGQAQSGTPFDAVILDLTVRGGMGGRECIARLRQFDPDVPIVISSGYSNDVVLSDCEGWGVNRILAKPYRIEELSNVVGELLGVRAE